MKPCFCGHLFDPVYLIRPPIWSDHLFDLATYLIRSPTWPSHLYCETTYLTGRLFYPATYVTWPPIWPGHLFDMATYFTHPPVLPGHLFYPATIDWSPYNTGVVDLVTVGSSRPRNGRTSRESGSDWRRKSVSTTSSGESGTCSVSVFFSFSYFLWPFLCNKYLRHPGLLLQS